MPSGFKPSPIVKFDKGKLEMLANMQTQSSPRSTSSTPRNPAELADQANAALDAIDAGRINADADARLLQRMLAHQFRQGAKQGSIAGYKAAEKYALEKMIPRARDRALGLGFLLGAFAGGVGAVAFRGIIS